MPSNTDIIIILILTLALIAFILLKIQNEYFTVSDAENIFGYNKSKSDLSKVENTFTEDKLTSPSLANTVDYDKYNDDYYVGQVYNKVDTQENNNQKDPLKRYITKNDFGEDTLFKAVSCSNSSIANKFKQGPVKLVANQVNCGGPNYLTGENFYKVNETVASPIEDRYVKGSNYYVYSDSVRPTEINKWILSYNSKGLNPADTKTRNIPNPFGFAFHNTPAMAMP